MGGRGWGWVRRCLGFGGGNVLLSVLRLVVVVRVMVSSRAWRPQFLRPQLLHLRRRRRRITCLERGSLGGSLEKVW
jgi:hypothetical protein